MINKKLMIIGSLLVAAALTVGVSLCTKAYTEKINVVDYREPEEINESGYQITKYEDVNAIQWIDENNVLALKSIPLSNNNQYAPKKLMSIYNLNSKTYKDYNDVIITAWDVKGVSPDGKYLLYSEQRNMPEPESEEWKRQEESQELFHEKMNILNLSTGDIIEDFDKVINNCSAQYWWISGDHIFVNYGGEWAIKGHDGKLLKTGTINFDNCYDDYATIIGIDDIEDSGEDISGEFNYTKAFMGSDGSVGIGVYSMDINSMNEELIYKSEDSIDACKMGKNIVLDYFNNNGEADEDGVYENRTFGIKVINKSGQIVRDIELPEDGLSDLLQLSPTGERASFVNVTDHRNYTNRSTLGNSIKVLNVSNGNLTELGRIENLMDKEKHEEFYRMKLEDEDGNILTRELSGPAFGTMQWDESGNSLFYTYKYTSKEDGENHTDTYVVSFDE